MTVNLQDKTGASMATRTIRQLMVASMMTVGFHATLAEEEAYRRCMKEDIPVLTDRRVFAAGKST